MELEAIILLCTGVAGIIVAIILVSMGFGKPVIGAISKAGRKACGYVTKRFSKKI